MAKIHEEVIIVKASRLVKDDQHVVLINEETVVALEQVAQELLGDSVIVEVERVS